VGKKYCIRISAVAIKIKINKIILYRPLVNINMNPIIAKKKKKVVEP
jgi:hypothetical protein